MAKLKGVLKGLQRFKDSVEDLPASDFKYKSSRSKKTTKKSDDEIYGRSPFAKFLKRLDEDPALRERVKRQFDKGDKGLFTEGALKQYKSGKGTIFKKLNPTPEEVSQALSKKKPVRHNKGGLAKGARAGKKVAEAIERRAKAANRKKDKAKEDEKKDKRKAMALAGATGATLAGAVMLGGEKEKARLKKEKERMNKIQKKKAGGLVTRWESKWG
jgi:hypothetical protein